MGTRSPFPTIRSIREREGARNPVNHAPSGGVWQGLNAQTGAVASAVWVRGNERSLVFIEIDGERVDES